MMDERGQSDRSVVPGKPPNTAEGPAAEIVVTHVLDADLDLDTFQLDEFGFGDLTVPVPAGRQVYSTRLDLRSTVTWREDVEVALERLLGAISAPRPVPSLRNDHVC